MSRRFIRHLGLLMLLFSSQAMAIGLGDIRLNSALNEPLRAEIVLLSATADEIADLKVDLASEQTFTRYGIDRPFFLQGLEFNIRAGSGNDQIVEIRSRAPITEPFLTFLVEATWSSGRLLREYTVLLDPPTYAPPAVQQPAAVSAPQRSTTPDSGRIQSSNDARPAAPTTEPTQSAPTRSTPASSASSPKPQPPASNLPYDSSDGGDHVVQRSETLWGIAARLRPDSRLTMNQTMLAIYEANRDSFGGNINMLREGASLRIPSADQIFQISRGDALSEVQRQHSAWGTTDYSSAAAAGDSASPSTGPSLTLVPPDEEPAGSIYDAAPVVPLTREEEVENRIADLEAADVPDQQSLIEIRDNELASLRRELADIRGEIYEPIVDEPLVDDSDTSLDGATTDETGYDEIFADEDGTATDDANADDTGDAEADTAPPVTTSTNSRNNNQSLIDKTIAFLSGIWGIIIGAVVLVLGALFWFMRRGSDDDDSGPWQSLDDDSVPTSLDGDMSATESLQAPGRDDAFVVVEGDTGEHQALEETIESPAADGDFGSLEDTFSSETAVNLDQTDPIAEADFHMAYGLYDQAADLINGALETDPNDKALMSKLCEIYFVWGNRDAFVDAATNLKAAVGDDGGAEWDKIVIMGQQIAADHSLFAGVVGATAAVDLAFDEGGSDDGALDMDFGESEGGSDDVIDLGGDSVAADNDGGVDFNFDDTGGGDALDLDLEATAENPTVSVTATEKTVEMPAQDTVESPTIEEPFDMAEDGTSELPSLDESLGAAIADSGLDADATAEINLDDLDLDVAGLADAELDDLDATGQNEALVDVSIDESLLDSTGRNPEIDSAATGVREALDATDENMRLATDETGRSPMVDAETDLASTDFGIDDDLLDATGRTQVLSDDLAVPADSLGDDDATMMAPGLGSSDAETVLASLDDDADDFDFAKTEALPPDAYTGDTDLEATAESKTIEELAPDLDDLASALEGGDTVEQPRDDATVEQPRPSIDAASSAELPTMSLSPDDMSNDLQEARTMTEVGTKLDLARAYVDMGDPAGARSILEEVLDEGDAGQKQQAQQLLDSLPS